MITHHLVGQTVLKHMDHIEHQQFKLVTIRRLWLYQCTRSVDIRNLFLNDMHWHPIVHDLLKLIDAEQIV